MANKVLLSSAGSSHLHIQLRALLTSALAFLAYTNSQCTAASASRKLSNFPAAGRYKSSVSARSQSLRPPTLNLNTLVSVSVTQASQFSERGAHPSGTATPGNLQETQLCRSPLRLAQSNPQAEAWQSAGSQVSEKHQPKLTERAQSIQPCIIF